MRITEFVWEDEERFGGLLSRDVVERLAVPGEVDDAGGDVHVHDPVHYLKRAKIHCIPVIF